LPAAPEVVDAAFLDGVVMAAVLSLLGVDLVGVGVAAREGLFLVSPLGRVLPIGVTIAER
jgi:hypothetical protein